MKYTFQRKDVVDFLCSKCYNLNELTFNTEITGDPEDSITPRMATPYVHSSIVKCGRCGGKMFAVDANIGKYIQQLNLLGYETKSCCGGHNIKQAINPRVVGPNPKPGENYDDYRFNSIDGPITSRTKMSIDINDIRGLPEHAQWIEFPFIMFSHHMRDIEKETLMKAASIVLKDHDAIIVNLLPCNSHGTLLSTTEVKLGESEYSLVDIKTDKNHRKELSSIRCTTDETGKIKILPDIISEFESVLADLVIELSKPCYYTKAEEETAK